MENLQELGANPFPYIVPVIPRPLPAKLIRGKHFVLADLLKSILGISSQARSAQEQEPQAKVAEKALASFVWLDQSPLAEQDSQPTPQAAKKKKRKKAKKKLDRSRLLARDKKALWITWIQSLVSRMRRGRTICLALLLDLLCGCASGLRAL